MTASSFARADRGRSLLSVLLVIAIVGGIAYLVNERFRSEVDQRYERLSAWTEDAIAADPVRYLEFVERRTRSTLGSLRASQINLAREQARLEARSTSAEVKIRAGTTALEELRGLFRSADAEGSFPVTWQGKPRSRDFLVDQMISLDTDLSRENAMREAVQKTLGGMAEARRKLGDIRARCELQLETITAEREIARVGQLDAKARERFAAMKGIIQEGASFEDSPDGLVSLDDLVGAQKEPPAGDRDAALQRILEGR